MTDLGFWRNAEEVLCIRTDNMGDVLMSTPAMRAVRGAAERRVTLLTSQAGAALTSFIPEVDEAIVYEAPWTPRRRDGRLDGDLVFVEALRQRRFDAAIVFTVCTQDPMPAAYLSLLAGIPLRLAYEAQKGYGLLTDPVPDPETEHPIRHEVQRQLALVATVGFMTDDVSMSFHAKDRDRESVRGRLSHLGLAPGGFVALHPGATAPSRRYDPMRFAEVGRLLDRRGIPHVFVASASDTEVLEPLRHLAASGTPLLLDLTVGEMGALFADAATVVANNSGPGHLAAAVGTPIVSLYARTNMQHAPWGVPARTLGTDPGCAPCLSSVCHTPGHPCLDVSPESVVDAIVPFLSAPHAVRRPVIVAGGPRTGSREAAL